MDYKKIRIQQIEENTFNPNELIGDLYEHLKHEIARVGFLQPILVRPTKDDTYQIIDGAHRYRALKELGEKEVPCIVTEVDEAEAKIRVINMNRIKGELNPVKMAELLEDLESLYNKDTLSSLLAMSEREIEAFQILRDMGDDFIPNAGKGEEPDTRVYSFEIEDVLVNDVEKALSLTGKDNRNSAFLELCLSYNSLKEKEKEEEVINNG